VTRHSPDRAWSRECFGLSDLKGYRTGRFRCQFLVQSSQIASPPIRAIRASSPYPFRRGEDDRCADLPCERRRSGGSGCSRPKVAIELPSRNSTSLLLIDMFCYRRHVTNESDEPMFTQPWMYKKIPSHPGTVEDLFQAADRRRRDDRSEVEKPRRLGARRLDAETRRPAPATSPTRRLLDGKWAGFKSRDAEEDPRRGGHRVDVRRLKDLAASHQRGPTAFGFTARCSGFWKIAPRRSTPASGSIGRPARRWHSHNCWGGRPSRPAVGTGQRPRHLLSNAIGA